MSYPDAKRSRYGEEEDDDYNTAPSYYTENPPSKVLQVKNFPLSCMEAELVSEFGVFGRVVECVILPNKSQALVEFADMNDAMNCVEEHHRGRSVAIGTSPLVISYSPTKVINRKNEPSKLGEKVTHILLLNVHNPTYPINTNVIHSICNRIAEVVRIVVFKRRQVQVLVEFKTPEDATAVKKELHGADIYSGSCTLHIEYARTPKLNVKKNDENTWDYTNPSLNMPERSAPKAGLLEPPPDYRPPPRYDPYYDYPRYDAPHHPPPPMGYNYDTAYPMPRDSGYSSRGYESDDEPATMMVYGMNANLFDCDKLFNLLCLFGNVNKVKFLISKEGCAMVEMAGKHALERAMQALLHVKCFGRKLELSYSKQNSVNDVKNVKLLPNGKPSFENYATSRFNRFTTPKAASRNRIQVPKDTLHFYNCPPGTTEPEIRGIINKFKAPQPVKMSFLPSRDDKSKVTGMMQFDSVNDATDCILLVNNTPVVAEETSSYMKLCFSQSGSSRD